jgi:spore coat polysaccharide biosynthesis protein SpsF
MIRRLRRAQTIDGICVATTDDVADQPIVDLCDELGVAVYRGSEDDVLIRVLEAAHFASADVIVELTADCPFIDPAILDACVLAYFATDVHFCSNTDPPTFPRGLDVKVFSTSVLAEVARRTDDAADHEHVSLYIYEHPERYRLLNLLAPGSLAQPELRWTVDVPEDLELVRRMAAALPADFTTAEAIALLATHPDWLVLNSSVRQKPVR